MADDGQHPSNCKNPKPTFRNPHKFNEEEVVYSISSSDEENNMPHPSNRIDLGFEPLELYRVFHCDSDSESEENTDEDEDGRDSTAPEWSDMPTNMKNFPFLKTNETLVPTPGNNEPIDYFRWICDDIFLNSAVDGTNDYAQVVLRNEGTLYPQITQWKPLTLEELLTFIALVLHTGTMNNYEVHWKSHPLCNLKCFSAHMSRDRFFFILRCLRFANNPAEEEAPRNLRIFNEMTPVFNFFNNMMSSIYYPGKELTIDEPMVLSHGRLFSYQSIKNKRNKRAVRLYMLTEPSGMILKSLVVVSDRERHRTRVVLELLEGYLDNGHSVYMDDFYNSFDLVDQLTKRSTYCTGILDVNRKNNPETVIMKKIEKGETVVQYANNIMVGKWRDVLYISNEYGNDLIKYTDNSERRKKPKSILYYNKYMGGIDRQDELNSFYPCEREILIWSNKLTIHFIQMMLFNSHLLFNKCSQTKMSLCDFRLAVLSSLLHIEPTTPVSRDDDSLHVLTKIPSVRNDGRVNRKRCRECFKNKLCKQTIYHCSKCPDQPGFCVGECFTKAHL